MKTDVKEQEQALTAEQVDTLNEQFENIKALLNAGGRPGFEWVFGTFSHLLENIWVSSPLVPWKEVEIGGIAGHDLVEQLRSMDNRVTSEAAALVCSRKHHNPDLKRTVTLARCTVRDFGFIEQPTIGEFLERVEKIGGLCPPEVAPYLRKKLGQGWNDGFLVAMVPIKDSHGDLTIFALDCLCNGRQALHSPAFSLDDFVSLDEEFVVCLL